MHPLEALSDLFDDGPPDILYHYTNQAGLLGILRSKKMWATNAAYVNDLSESEHARNLITFEIAKRMGDQSTDSADKSLLGKVLDVALESAPLDICLASFSTDDDSLSQFRAYGGRTGGFAIGFAGADIARLREITLFRCRYRQDETAPVVAAIVDELLAILRNKSDAYADHFRTDFSSYVHTFGSMLKNPTFADEKEWRAVAWIDKPTRLEFRRGRSMVIPYYPIPIDSVRVLRIVVGPTVHNELSRRSVEGLIARLGCPPVEVKSSRIPLRNW